MAMADPETDENTSTVTLGDVSFDPVQEQDFRLSVEGTSGTGKSNTLAVILEDLADVAIPTLIVERLGALSPARLEDEDIVVVAALVETFDVDVDVDLPPAPEAETTTDGTGTEPPTSSTAEASIMAEFQQEAIDRIVSTVEGLNDRQCRLLKYIEARGQTLSSQKQWAQQTFGLQSDPSGTHYEDMSELIDEGFVRKNKDGSIAPNVRGKVEDELGDYDADDGTIEETYEQVLSNLAV